MGKHEQRRGSWAALELAFELGYLIAIPLIVLAFLGRFLDRRLETHPWLLLAGVFAALTISSVAVARKAMEVMHEDDGDAQNGEARNTE